MWFDEEKTLNAFRTGEGVLWGEHNVGAAAHALTVLADDVRMMLVEPFAGDEVENNLNVLGRIFYTARQFSMIL